MIASLPVGGTITRIACGNTTRRRVRARDIPSAAAASVWPRSTDWMPARTISDMYAASLRLSPRIAAVIGEISWFASRCTPGIPKLMTG